MLEAGARYTAARDLRMELVDDGRVRFRTGGEDTVCEAAALRLVAAFAQPVTLAEALESIPVRGSEDWKSLGRCAALLVSRRVLVADTHGEPRLSPLPGGFGNAEVHIRMLDDEQRCLAYRRAIERIVKPGDVVVDIGTGTGLLAMFAARCGARRVYAIESGPAASVARAAIEANGLSDIVEVIPGLSTTVTLPERADVVVTETIGDNPLSEHVVTVLRDARQRFAHDKTRFIPESLELLADVVRVPNAVHEQLRPGGDTLHRWRARYGLDLGALRDATQSGALRTWLPTQETRSWVRAAHALPLAELTLAHVDIADVDARHRFATDCDPDGVLIWFRLTLGEGVSLDVDPATTPRSNHWHSPLWCFPPRESVGHRENWQLRYRCRDDTEQCELGPVD